MFNQNLLREADAAAHAEISDASGTASDFPVKLPLTDFSDSKLSAEESVEREISRWQALEPRAAQRNFNERKLLEDHKENVIASRIGTKPPSPDGQLLPSNVTDNEYFKSRFGYSLIKESKMPLEVMQYSQLDMWGELPKYTDQTYFLYLVSRRRNCYAVLYDFKGNRVHPTYSAGNRGFKKGDKGWQQEGSAEVANQVTSMYLNDAIPKLREMEVAAGRSGSKDRKIDLVVRVLGFYNGRQGAIRAVSGRDDVFSIRYFEDITPFPLNGPRMPKRLQK